MPMPYETVVFPLAHGYFPDPPCSLHDGTPELKRLFSLIGECYDDYAGHKAFHFVTEHGWHITLFKGLYEFYDCPEWDFIGTDDLAFVSRARLQDLGRSLALILEHIRSEFPVVITENFPADLIKADRTYQQQAEAAAPLPYGDWDLTYDLGYTISGFISFLKSLQFSIDETLRADQILVFVNMPPRYDRQS